MTTDRTHPATIARALALGLALAALAPPVCEAAWLTAPDGTRLFLRAVGYSPFHPREGARLSPGTQATDRRLVRDLNANCVLTWGATSFEDVAAWYRAGVYTLPQVPYTPPQLSVFANGRPAPAPVYVNEDNRRGLRTAARDMASALKGSPGVAAVSLGNQYAWSAFSPDLGFSYAGFDRETIAAFHAHLRTRFSSVEQLIDLTGQEVTGVSGILPPVGLTPSPVMWEWWLFMSDTFAEFLRRGHEGLQAVGWDAPTTYAQPCGVPWDPASEGPAPPYLDIVSGNVFYDHVRDWGKFCATIAGLIAGARGRPVLVTEVGAHTLHRDENEAGRIIKQSIACALLHPEVAGVGVYEFCDDWQRGGRPEVHDETGDREHWGLVTAHRAPKQTFRAAQEMFGLIRREEKLFQQWQAPPLVLLSRQDLDWWKLRGPEGRLYQRVATELYRQGLPFRLVDNAGLLELDPTRHPRLILCDTFLPVNPDGSGDALGRIVSYIENGGDVLYLSRMPWQSVYGRSIVPQELRVPADRGPTSRSYGAGRISIVPTAGLDDRRLYYLVEDYLAEHFPDRPLAAVKPADLEARAQVFWRVFEDDEGLWLWAVNTGPQPLARVEFHLGPGMNPRAARLRAADGARLGHAEGSLHLSNLNVHALVHLGVREREEFPPPPPEVGHPAPPPLEPEGKL